MRASDWITLPLVIAAGASLAFILSAGMVYELFFGRARICPLCGNAVDAKRRYRNYRITPSRN